MIEVLANEVTPEGMRFVKVVSDVAPVPFCVPGGAIVSTWSDDALGLYYLVAEWACREAILIKCEGWPSPRPFVLWKLRKGERVSEALKKMVGTFGGRFKCFPDYAFMKRLPKGVEPGFEVDDVMFCEGEWVPPGCIAVCKGEQYGFEAMALQE